MKKGGKKWENKTQNCLSKCKTLQLFFDVVNILKNWYKKVFFS